MSMDFRCVGGPLDGRMQPFDLMGTFEVYAHQGHKVTPFGELVDRVPAKRYRYDLVDHSIHGMVWLCANPGLWTLKHVYGCGGPAFKRISRPEPGDRIDAEAHRHLDGSAVSPHDRVVCESCGKPLSMGDLEPENFIQDAA